MWLQKSASIQKRTSPLKFDHFRSKIPDFIDRIFQQRSGERSSRRNKNAKFKECLNPPRPLASVRVEGGSWLRTLQSSKPTSSRGGFTLTLPLHWENPSNSFGKVCIGCDFAVTCYGIAFRASWVVLGVSWASLGASWTILGASLHYFFLVTFPAAPGAPL